MFFSQLASDCFLLNGYFISMRNISRVIIEKKLSIVRIYFLDDSFMDFIVPLESLNDLILYFNVQSCNIKFQFNLIIK